MRLFAVVVVFMLGFGTFAGSAWAQPDVGAADEHFKKGNYLFAIPEYLKVLKLERNSGEYNFKLAICYIKTNIDKTKAIPYLERAMAQDKKPAETGYYLGIAYMFDNRYEEALETLKNYKETAPSKDHAQIDQQIKNCEFALEKIQSPINVTFENLGPQINSEYPDYYPFTTADEQNIYFTSRRKDGKSKKVEFDGYFASEVFTTSYNGENYTPAKNLAALNSTYDDQIVGLSADGESLFLFSTGTEVKGVLYIANKKGAAFKKQPFIPQINSEKSIETSGFIAPGGDVIFFASNRSGGFGGLDLWMIRKLPNGMWGAPYNLGPEINTPGNEDFPTLSVDGQYLYFSSNGRTGFGGYDLYKCEWFRDEGTFTTPENIGYPLNTAFDELTISFPEDSKHAYVSAWRKDGIGDLDIYRVTFEEVEAIQTLFIITLPDPKTPGENIKDGLITIMDQNGDVVGDYRANQNTGKFSIILGPGKFTMSVEVEGYQLHEETLKVNEFTHRMGMIQKQITLTAQ